MLKLNGFFAVFGISALIYLMPSAGAEGVVQLASNGKTDYLIVKSGNASAVDDYAVKTLAKYLNQITGAEFPVVDAADVAETSHCIFVGLSGPALKRLGMDDPLGVLKDQEHVCRSKGDNIFLYGKMSIAIRTRSSKSSPITCTARLLRSCANTCANLKTAVSP